MESPPKRVTRARAAAKKDDTAVKPNKIATAASKVKVARVTAATTKRKTRADDEKEDVDELQQDVERIIEPEPAAVAKTTRGRAKKPAAVQQDDEEMMDAPPIRATRGRAVVELEQMEELPAAKTTRARPKKVIIETPSELVKSTRVRAKKTEVPATDATIEEPKRTTRGRATTITKPALPKKSVKFEEPDKENVVPVAAIKGKPKAAAVGTGLRAKPVRKPAVVPAPRATRGRGKVEEKRDGSSPLSPKKVTQVGSTAKDSQSDDELAATEKTPMKPLMRSPVKPPGSIFNAAKKLDFGSSTKISVSRMITQDLNASVMASPARRPPQSPFKETFNASPQRVQVQSSLQSPFKPSLGAPKSTSQNSAFKASLLQSPARRPVASPTKVDEAGSPSRGEKKGSIFSATPKATPFKISRFATPRTLNIKNTSRPGQSMAPPSAPPKFSSGSPKGSKQQDDSTMTVEPKLKFSGRLSSIMPRSADPALIGSSTPIVEEIEQEPEDTPEEMELDQVEVIAAVEAEIVTSTPPMSPSRKSTGSFELRRQDESPFDDSDSEDELASASPKYSPLPLGAFNISPDDFASSPVQFESISTPKRAKSARPSLAAMRSERKETIGFTPLAQQLSTWLAASPEKSEADYDEEVSPTASPSKSAEVLESPAEPSPSKSHFFEDEMTVRDEMTVEAEPAEVPEIEQNFGPVVLDEEDMALADEADEMSILEPHQLDIPGEDVDMFAMPEIEQFVEIDVSNLVQMGEPVEDLHLAEHEDSASEQPEPTPATPFMEQTFEQALSEASQEYGDENSMPIDPALFAPVPPAVPSAPHFHTPKRVLMERTFHTVSKVPLKAAADDTPMRPSPLKRSSSSSRIPSQRPTTNLTRKNTVISYSPTKNTPRPKTPQGDANATPKTEWSTVATPARTPRSDLNTQLLKGAVVYVDVHTTEGADASVLFTELLTQMGARCVKTWNWNGEEGGKIGITHVVFKDGGKRTIERVRETNGVVSCVGVGWVLE